MAAAADASAAFKLWKRGQKLGEGTFGEVYIATHEHTGEKAALKKIKLECEDEGVPGTTLPECGPECGCRGVGGRAADAAQVPTRRGGRGAVHQISNRNRLRRSHSRCTAGQQRLTLSHTATRAPRASCAKSAPP